MVTDRVFPQKEVGGPSWVTLVPGSDATKPSLFASDAADFLGRIFSPRSNGQGSNEKRPPCAALLSQHFAALRAAGQLFLMAAPASSADKQPLHAARSRCNGCSRHRGRHPHLAAAKGSCPRGSRGDQVAVADSFVSWQLARGVRQWACPRPAEEHGSHQCGA